MFTAFIKILPVGEMPVHNHEASSNTTGNHEHTIYYGANDSWQYHGSGNIIGHIGINGSISKNTSTNGNHNHIVTISNTGSSQSHNNMEPYIVVYMWKRTD